jgi:hypothetical protein
MTAGDVPYIYDSTHIADSGQPQSVLTPGCYRIIDQPAWYNYYPSSTPDVGAIMNALWIAHGAGTCISFDGLPSKIYGATNPWDLTNGGNAAWPMEIRWPIFTQFVTSVMWQTTSADNVIAATGEVNGGSKTGVLLAACVTSGGCGYSGASNKMPEFTSAATGTAGGTSPLNLVVGSWPHTTSSGTATFSSSTSLGTGNIVTSATNISASMAGGILMVSTGTSGLSSCVTTSSSGLLTQVSGTTCYTAHINSVCVTSGGCMIHGWSVPNNSFVLDDIWADSNGPTGSSISYVVHNPNAAALLWPGSVGHAFYMDTFGERIGPIRLDGEGIAGYVGFYTHSVQEDSLLYLAGQYNGGIESSQDSSIQGPGVACYVADRSFENGGTSQGGSGSHANWYITECATNGGQTSMAGVGSGTYDSDGLIWEAFPLTKTSIADGADNIMYLGSLLGTSSAPLVDAIFAEGGRQVWGPVHVEFALRAFHFGKNHLTTGQVVLDPSTANQTNGEISGAAFNCNNATPIGSTTSACVQVYFDTYASWGNQVLGTDGEGYSDVDYIYDLENGCGDGTSAPCRYNSTSSTSSAHIAGRVLQGTYYQPMCSSNCPVSNVVATTLLGTPTAPTPTISDNSQKVATTAYVQGQGYVTTTAAQAAFSGVGSCTNQVVTGSNANAAPTCSSLATAQAGANVQGNGTKFQLSAGSPVSGDYASFDANKNAVDSTVVAGPYASFWAIPGSVSTTSPIACSSTASKATIWGISLTYPLKTSNVTYYVQGADNSANTYDLGLYSASGSLVVHTGSLAGTTFAPTASHYTSQPWTAANTVIQPGNYYLALTCSATSGTATFGYTYTWAANANATEGVGTGGSLPSSMSVPGSLAMTNASTLQAVVY